MLHLRRGVLETVLDSGTSVFYWLRDLFSTDEVAPMVTPHVCDVGKLLIYDGATFISTNSGKLAFANPGPGNYTGATVKSQDAIPPHCGRALLADVNHSVNQSANKSLAYFSANDNNGAAAASPAYMVRDGTPTAIYSSGMYVPLDIQTASWTLNQTRYLAIVQRQHGYFFLVKNTTWKLAFASSNYFPASLYPGFNLHTGAFTADNLKCIDWGGVWATQYGLATDRKATAAANDNLTTTAQFIAEITTGLLKTNDVFEVTIRKTDADNRWIIRLTNAATSTLKIIEKTTGTETERASVNVNYMANLDKATIYVLVDGNLIQAYVQSPTNSLVSATTNHSSAVRANVTGIETGGAGTEFVSYPVDVDALVPTTVTPISTATLPNKNIAFLGGSITKGDSGSWVTPIGAYISQLLCDSYRFTYYNRGVNSTGSDRALANLSTEIYPITPSLVFIEFCVNDSDAGAQTNGEALIRAIRTNLPNTNLCMIFFGDGYDRNTNNATNGSDSTRAIYQALCEHYSIPFVNMAAELSRAVEAGEYTVANYTADNTHPNTFGSGRAADLLKTIMTSDLVLGGTQTGALPDPLYP